MVFGQGELRLHRAVAAKAKLGLGFPEHALRAPARLCRQPGNGEECGLRGLESNLLRLRDQIGRVHRMAINAGNARGGVL